MMRLWRVLLAGVLLLGLLLSSGCGETDKKTGSEAEKLKIENYTFSGAAHSLVFTAKPKRVVVAGNSAIDTLIALGEQESIVAAVLSEKTKEQHYKKLLPKVDLQAQSFSQESVMAYKPDFILGWRRYFGDKQMGNTTFWASRRIPAYIQEASGPIPSLEGFPPCTIASEKKFINNMGKVFHKEQRAAELVKEIDVELAKVKDYSGKKPRVLVVEFLGKRIEMFGPKLLSGDIVKALGGELVFYEQPFISKEELLMLDADIIFVVHHGQEYLRDLAIKEMYSPIYNNINAVKNKRVYPLAYEMIVAPTVKLKDTIRYMRQKMYEPTQK